MKTDVENFMIMPNNSGNEFKLCKHKFPDVINPYLTSVLRTSIYLSVKDTNEVVVFNFDVEGGYMNLTLEKHD